ncbi:tetratricopeptide repeat protein [soil metagenome]
MGSPIAASMAGAVDLSGLKQRAQTTAGPDSPTGPPVGTEVTEVNFEADVLVRSNQMPVVVVLWSPRSDASAQLAEVLAALALQDQDKPGRQWALTTVNVDTTPRVAQIFGVQAVPTVVAIAAGQPLSNFEGVQPPEQLRKWIDSLLNATSGKLGDGAEGEVPEEVDPALAAARDHLEAGDLETAREAYQAILETDPTNVEAAGAVRQIGFLIRATAQRPDAVTVADAAPTDIEAAFAAADVQILNQDVKPAFDRLIALVRRTAGDERTSVRTRLIELFELFDAADPDVIAGRRNLANALY